MAQPVFQGGATPGASFGDLELEIDPYSMERTNEGIEHQRALQAFELVTTAAPAMAQTPWINWKMLFDRIGDARNDADFGEIVDANMLKQAVQQQQQQQAVQVQGEQQAQQGQSQERGTKLQSMQADMGNKRMVAQSAAAKNRMMGKAAMIRSKSQKGRSSGANRSYVKGKR